MNLFTKKKEDVYEILLPGEKSLQEVSLPTRFEEMICMSGTSVLIVAKSVFANRRIFLAIMTSSIYDQLQSDEGRENT
ncbi:MAG: hypothetical protein M3044_06695 [Thermoproteota archaeon]|nr:hypothetical protein [Thermoproteota archaeon]